NDFWKLPYAELFANMTVRVYNRWGALIWSAKGTEIGDGWDGKNSNGKDYPVGTYYYVIDYNVEGTTKWKSVSGSITIVR
ncbi:MAG TPA: gliding motility-associated C-terminal domain-containing protein, partial [Tenuifilaceae bacterium]|nr:gliding motility-associated C-terminal domain-containing protein [Tenuifilaceae bacterium]